MKPDECMCDECGHVVKRDDTKPCVFTSVLGRDAGRICAACVERIERFMPHKLMRTDAQHA